LWQGIKAAKGIMGKLAGLGGSESKWAQLASKENAANDATLPDEVQGWLSKRSSTRGTPMMDPRDLQVDAQIARVEAEIARLPLSPPESPIKTTAPVVPAQKIMQEIDPAFRCSLEQFIHKAEPNLAMLVRDIVETCGAVIPTSTAL